MEAPLLGLQVLISLTGNNHQLVPHAVLFALCYRNFGVQLKELVLNRSKYR